MAGIGDAWGTREELLHPRDKHGRFKSKWKMPAGTAEKILGFLAAFRPRTFQSDQQAAQYTQNLGGKKRFSRGELVRLHADYNPAQEDLRDGIADEPSTKKFVQMMDSHAIDLPDDLITSRVVGPDAFGLTPQNIDAENGGLADFTGKKIADRGYSATSLGTPLGGGAGQITMTIAVPKGTKATFTGEGGNDRTMYLERGQPLRITKVDSDGRGGHYVLAVAEGHGGDAPEPIGGHVGAGRTGDREARVRDLSNAESRRMKAEPDQPGTPAPAAAPDNNAAPVPQQALPDGTQPRVEPNAAESIGGAPSPATPAAPAAPEAATPAVPGTATPAVPAAPAGPPLEDADVAKLRQRRDARDRYRAIADRVPQGNAGAELAELVNKKADNKTIATHIRSYANGPGMDEVDKDQRERVKHELEQVATAFEQDKPTLGKQRMAKYLDQSNIELVGGPRDGGLTHREQGAGKTVPFDEKYMDSTGDIPEDGKVEVIRPAVVYHPKGTGAGATDREVVLEKAVVTVPTKKTRAPRKAAAPKAPAKKTDSDDDILSRAQKISGPPKTAEDKELLRRASEISEQRNKERTDRLGSGTATVAEAPMKAFGQGPDVRAGAKKAQKKAAPDTGAALTEMPEGDAAIQAAARKLSGPPKNDIERRVLAEAADISTRQQDKTRTDRLEGKAGLTGNEGQLLSGKKATPAKKAAKPSALEDAAVDAVLGKLSPQVREASLKALPPDMRAEIEASQIRHKARMEKLNAPKAAKKAAPAKAAVPAATAGEIPEKATIADLRKIAAERGVDLKGARLKADIRSRIEGGAPSAPVKKAAPAAPSVPGEITDKTTVAQLRQIAADRGVDLKGVRLKADIRKRIEGSAPETPKAPAAVKKVAPAAPGLTPETSSGGLPPYKAPGPTAPSTRAGKQNQARLLVGNRVLLNPNGTPASKKTGAVEVAITARNSDGTLKAVDANGKEFRVGAHPEGGKYPGYQTYFLGKDPDATPTKAVKKAAPAAPSTDSEENARIRQSQINDARKVGDLTSKIDELVNNEADPAAIRAIISNEGKRLGTPGDVQAALLNAAVSGDRKRIDAALEKAEKAAGIERIGKAGETVGFDPKLHSVIGGDAGVRRGAKVDIVRPGHHFDRDGERIQLGKAQVLEAETPPAKPDVLPINLGPEAAKVIENATPDSIRAEAKKAGYGDLEGVTKDDLITDLARKMIAKGDVQKPGSENKTPDKVTALPAPIEATAKAVAPSVPKMSTNPPIENVWGMFQDGEVNFHDDGEIGMAIKGMGQDRNLEVDGDSLENVLGKLATDNVVGRKTQQEVIDRIKEIQAGLPDGPGKRALRLSLSRMDTEKRAPLPLPDDTPAPVKLLMEQLSGLPIAREGRDGTPETSEMNRLKEIADQRAGSTRVLGWINDLRRLRNSRHESREGKFELDRYIDQAIRNLEPGKKKVDVPGAVPVKEAAPAKGNQAMVGRKISGGQLEQLKPGDEVTVPRTKGAPTKTKTVSRVDSAGTAWFTDGSKQTKHSDHEITVESVGNPPPGDGTPVPGVPSGDPRVGTTLRADKFGQLHSGDKVEITMANGEKKEKLVLFTNSQGTAYFDDGSQVGKGDRLSGKVVSVGNPLPKGATGEGEPRFRVGDDRFWGTKPDLENDATSPLRRSQTEADIRRAYAQLLRERGREPGADSWVSLQELRPLLEAKGYSRQEVDNMLLRMSRDRGAGHINLTPDAAGHLHTQDFRLASVHFGNQDKNKISMKVTETR